jgi:hypothetical protein
VLPSDTHTRRKPINVHYSCFTSICDLFTDSPPYLVSSTSYEAHHYAVFSSRVLFHFSLVQISSAPRSLTSSLHITDKVSHSYKTTGRIVVSLILFLLSPPPHNIREDNSSGTEWSAYSLATLPPKKGPLITTGQKAK